MLLKINRLLERGMPILTPCSVVLGVALSDRLIGLSFLIPWVFALMTFSGGLQSDLHSLRRALARPWPLIVAFFILHAWMPFLAWGTGHLLFADDPQTSAGLILAMAIPTGITSFIWVAMRDGNRALALTIILIDTLLAPIVVPHLLSFYAGKMIVVDRSAMMKGLLLMIALPSMLGMAMNQWSGEKIPKKINPFLAPFSKIGLQFVVMANSSVVAPYLTPFTSELFLVAAAVAGVAFSGYVSGVLIGKVLKWNREDIVTLMFCGGMRNITTGAVIAIAYFPRAVSIPVVLAMLLQQALASFAGKFLLNFKKDREDKRASA